MAKPAGQASWTSAHNLLDIVAEPFRHVDFRLPHAPKVQQVCPAAVAGPGPLLPLAPRATPLTIRKTLLLAFLLVGVTPAVLLALMAFERASMAVQAEIEHGLAAQADALQSDVTKLMYERLQNAATWRRIELMQDLQVEDVDKRLSSFLQRLALGYGGLYPELAAVNGSGRVVASSDAAHIGRAAEPGRPWQVLMLGDSRITLDLPHAAAGPARSWMTLRTPIASAFGDGALGELQLHFDWSQVDRLLERAATGGRMLALVDAQGRVVAGSQRLLSLLPRLSTDLADWSRPAANGPAVVMGRAPLPAKTMFIGLSQARGFADFAGFGWSVMVLVPQDDALAPIHAMGVIFAALLGAVVVITVIASGLVSQAIARPIVALTRFSRSYRLNQQQPLPPAPLMRSSEVGELRNAFVQMVKDIEQSQQQLARASALAAVGEMSAIIAHEIRTPLGIVLSSAQIVQREASLSDEGRELLSFIESETTRLNRLVSSMLESTRPRKPNIAPADVAELIQHTVGLLSAQAATQGVQISTRLEARNEPFDCDVEQMTQVLLNLVLNGLQILGQGGRIDISTRDAGGQLIIDIADDGPGIEPQARSRIFEAFYFQREGGIGLGLAVVQKIVAEHGGQIEASESELGGALFRISLPRGNRDST